MTPLPQTFTVDVTAEDIAKGKEMNCWRCPVALALSREFPLVDLVWTAHYEVVVVRKLNDRHFIAPSLDRFAHDAGAFMAKFDVREFVAPRTITFTRKDEAA